MPNLLFPRCALCKPHCLGSPQGVLLLLVVVQPSQYVSPSSLAPPPPIHWMWTINPAFLCSMRLASPHSKRASMSKPTIVTAPDPWATPGICTSGTTKRVGQSLVKMY